MVEAYKNRVPQIESKKDLKLPPIIQKVIDEVIDKLESDYHYYKICLIILDDINMNSSAGTEIKSTLELAENLPITFCFITLSANKSTNQLDKVLNSFNIKVIKSIISRNQLEKIFGKFSILINLHLYRIMNLKKL